MKLRKYTKLAALLLCAVVLVTLLPVGARADMGPKPSVHITFENMGQELCYATLLSKYPSSGPACAWDGTEENARYMENSDYYSADLEYEIWKAFVDYEDADGYYFLQTGRNVSQSKKFSWTYYPPRSFKILLYYPESQTFIVSGIYERYAFDSYYTVNMEGIAIGSVEETGVPQLYANRSYQYGPEILSLLIRIALTILLEIGVALLFGFREKKQFRLLVGVNAATQILLNVLLNVVNYYSGFLMFYLYYILLEPLIFVVEAVVYAIFMKKVSERPKKGWFCVLYALVANALSFGAGLLLAGLLPGIF